MSPKALPHSHCCTCKCSPLTAPSHSYCSACIDGQPLLAMCVTLSTAAEGSIAVLYAELGGDFSQAPSPPELHTHLTDRPAGHHPGSSAERSAPALCGARPHLDACVCRRRGGSPLVGCARHGNACMSFLAPLESERTSGAFLSHCLLPCLQNTDLVFTKALLLADGQRIRVLRRRARVRVWGSGLGLGNLLPAVCLCLCCASCCDGLSCPEPVGHAGLLNIHGLEAS